MITQDIPLQAYSYLVHESEEGGYWAEVIGLPGCFPLGETLEELRQHIREAISAVQPIAYIKVYTASCPTIQTAKYVL